MKRVSAPTRLFHSGSSSAAAQLSGRWDRLAEALTTIAALEQAVLEARKVNGNPYQTVSQSRWDAYFEAVPVRDAECSGLVTVLNKSTH